MINLNKLNNQQLEDRIYFIQREMQYDHGYMLASTVNKKMDEILMIRRILNQRDKQSETV
jgi:hypothetical protein